MNKTFGLTLQEEKNLLVAHPVLSLYYNKTVQKITVDNNAFHVIKVCAMSKVQVDSDIRPRTTKNVYFFKSGDHSFDGVRLPVNLRRYRTLDALLDDLSGKIPGLHRGVRQVRTPQGRNQVEKIDQLKHLGGYVCTEKLYQGRIPGINFDKVKSPKDLVAHENFINSSLPPKPIQTTTTTNTSPKRKKKKKKKKLRKIVDNEDAQGSNQEGDEIDEFVRNARDNERDRRHESEHEAQNEYDDDEDYAQENGRSQEDLDDVEDREEDEEREFQHQKKSNRNDYSNEPEEDFMATPEVVGKPSFSAPGTPAERRKFDDSPLAPLDNTKLKHVQRRRIATKKINAEDYTLPSTERSSISKSTTKTKKSTKSKKVQPNLQQRFSFDDRMRIEEYDTNQQEKILELEGKRESTPPVSDAQKARSATPTSMRSITPIHENESGSRQGNRERTASAQLTNRTRIQRAISNSKSISNPAMGEIATQIIQQETASNVQLAYGGHAEDESVMNSPYHSKPVTPFDDEHEAVHDDDHDDAKLERDQIPNQDNNDPDNEVKEWHDFMSSINDDAGQNGNHETSHENATARLGDLSEEENYSDEQGEWDEQEHERGSEDEHKQEHDHPHRDESEEEYDEFQNGSHKNAQSAKEGSNRADLKTGNALDEEWVDEYGTRRKSQFIVVSHPDDHESIAHGEKQMHKNTLRDSGVSSIDGEAVAAV